MMKVLLGIAVLAAIGVILAAIKRDWLALGISAIGLLTNIGLAALMTAVPAAH